MKYDIKSMSPEELQEYVASIGEKPFRAGQVFEWIHKKQVKSFAEMTNLSLSLREKLEEQCTLTVLKTAQRLESALDGTRKYLFALPDDQIIESVFMRYKHGNSVCISTQVGCRMGCLFCASTLDGLERQLLPSEMLEQVYRIEEDTGERVSNVVLMGSGEPLDNYDNTIKFLKLVTSEKGMNMSARNITVSTCGIVPAILRLAEEHIPVTLALSLHASDDETRKKLMPVANRYSLKEIMDACDLYYNKTGRRISFEYSLVAGVNDNEAEARALVKLLGRRNCHINLIAVNQIKEREVTLGSRPDIEKFKNLLEKSKINVTIRREMGRDINGACGQLRRSCQSACNDIPKE